MTVTKRATASLQPSEDPGSFDMVLSNGTEDRDGESILPGSWAQPLPDTIPLNANHSSDVSDIVGSGTPFIDEAGNLRVRGTFATTPEAQHIRTLVNEGHLRSVSVEFLRRKDGNGKPVNELVGGAFVNVPSNPTARVLASKAIDFEARLDAILSGIRTKAADTGDAAEVVQHMHDSALWLGAQCAMADDSQEEGKATALRLRLKALA